MAFKFISAFLLALSVHTQVSAGMSGTVTDTSGAVIPFATVTARNVETGAERWTTTDMMGAYQLLALSIGQYEIEVTKSGFDAAIRQGIHLSVGQQAVVNFTLHVGDIQQEVRVTEEVPAVSTTTADISGLAGAQQIKDLPLNGRSYDGLMTLN